MPESRIELLSRLPRDMPGNIAATSFRLALLFLVGREVATHLGSVGIVVMGQLQNLLSLGLAISALALQPGIHQAIGSALPDQVPRRSSWALLTGQVLALVSGIAILWFSTSGVVFMPAGVHHVVWMFLPGLLGMALIGNLQAIAGGRKHLKRLNLFIAISGPLQALWLFGWIHTGLQGLVPGILLFGLVLAPVAFWFLSPFPLSWPRRDQWREQLKLWAPLAAMGSVAAVSAPFLQISIRETILKQGVDVAGNWQAAVRVSDMLFATWYGAFATWVLPRLSGPPEKRPGLGILLLCPLGALVIGASLALFGPLVLDLAYVGRFPHALALLRMQCLAEFVRASSYPLGLMLIARRSAQAFSFLEVAGVAIQVGLVRCLVPSLGPIGAPLSIAIESALYFAAAAWFLGRRNVVPLAS